MSVDSSITDTPRFGIVVIGRNEGERLQTCIESALKTQAPIVYVDSGSSDDSALLAGCLGVDVVELDDSRPFTAARARNAGFAHLLDRRPNLAFVQFIDGDCELYEDWLPAALAAIEPRADVAVVCGRVRERFPRASIYNRICELEWRHAIGEVDASGGIFIARTEAFERVGGFNPEVIAAEDTELCTRLRLDGWKILSIDADMVCHDAAMLHVGQWFKRAMRAGHALTEGAVMHGRSPAKLFVRASRRIFVQGVCLPLIVAVLAWPTSGWSALLLLAYPGIWAKTYRDLRRGGQTSEDALLYATHCVAAKWPQAVGQVLYMSNRLRGRQSTIIEHKRPECRHRRSLLPS